MTLVIIIAKYCLTRGQCERKTTLTNEQKRLGSAFETIQIEKSKSFVTKILCVRYVEVLKGHCVFKLEGHIVFLSDTIQVWLHIV